jgi:hypothetical protein
MPDAVMLCLKCPRGRVTVNLRDAAVFCVRHGTLCPCYLEWLLLFKLQRPRSRVLAFKNRMRCTTEMLETWPPRLVLRHAEYGTMYFYCVINMKPSSPDSPTRCRLP